MCRQSWERAQLDVVKRLEKQLEAATTENESKSDENNPAVHSPAAEIRVLYKVGLLQLRKWIEEDAEAIEERKRQEDQEKAEQGSLAHQVSSHVLYVGSIKFYIFRAGCETRTDYEFDCRRKVWKK